MSNAFNAQPPASTGSVPSAPEGSGVPLLPLASYPSPPAKPTATESFAAPPPGGHAGEANVAQPHHQQQPPQQPPSQPPQQPPPQQQPHHLHHHYYNTPQDAMQHLHIHQHMPVYAPAPSQAQQPAQPLAVQPQPFGTVLLQGPSPPGAMMPMPPSQFMPLQPYATAPGAPYYVMMPSQGPTGGFAPPGYAMPAAMAPPPPPPPRDPNDKGPKQLIVNFLAPEVTSADLASVFQGIGPIDCARVIVDKVTGVSKQFGFVYFKRPEDAARSVHELTGFPMLGRRIKVTIASSQRPQ
uniref:RRM domain-containing protein n=1 Tax=Neobodo designis TaxID=312471 RepID=A0A7S1L294_NEODS|mmetsp:Transcript_13252/g.41219  ORF Transcript_13252/g.41219 Transcript_13252/m.41219 type:complete len:295 (+) Transcript_13252:508-1392(+)